MAITTQKTITIADGIIKLYATNAKDDLGNIVEITPMKTLKLFKETVPDLMGLIKTLTAPNISFDYYLPEDHNSANAVVQSYSKKTSNYARILSSNIDKIIDALSSVDTNYFSTKWEIPVSPNCVDIGMKIKNHLSVIDNELVVMMNANNANIDNLIHDMRQTSNSAVLIAAPTLSAVLSNEVTTARFNSSVSGYLRRFLAGCTNGINTMIAYQKALSIELPKILEEGLHEVEAAFIRGMTSIYGNATQKTWWKNLKEHPLSFESYIAILENESDICGLQEVAEYFEIDGASLKEACLNKLRRSLDSKAIGAVKTNKDTLFTNVCSYFNMNTDDLTAAMYANIISNTKDKLCSCNKHIPSSAISSIKAGNNPHDVAQDCICAIISQDDFVSLCEIAKEQLIQPLTKAFSIGGRSSAEDVYISMIVYIEKKLTIAKKILVDTNEQIDELNRKKAEYENERKHLGFLAFSKKKAVAAQISEVESQIRAAEIACQQKLNEL